MCVLWERFPVRRVVFAKISRRPTTGNFVLHGLLGIHVDDGICGGDATFLSKIQALETKFPFGSKKLSAFTFTTIEVSQQPDKSINLSQSAYVRKMNSIPIDPNRKTQPELAVTENERLALRGLVGSLQYASTNTRPDLASRLSLLQSEIPKATVGTLQEGNKLLHEAKRHHDVTITIRPIPVADFRFMAFSDASFASQKKPDSHAGLFIVGTHQKISQNLQCPISPVSWGCKKIQKVVTSTLSAETNARRRSGIMVNIVLGLASRSSNQLEKAGRGTKKGCTRNLCIYPEG